MIDNKFKILRQLGKGSSSRVFLVEDFYSNKVAIKAIRNDRGYGDQVAAELMEREHFLLEKMANHPNIIKPYFTQLDGQISYNSKIENIMYMAMEHADNGSIADFIAYTGGIEEKCCRLFMAQI